MSSHVHCMQTLAQHVCFGGGHMPWVPSLLAATSGGCGARQREGSFRRGWARSAAPARHTHTRAREHTRVHAHDAHSKTHFHSTAQARPLHISAPAHWPERLAAVRAGAAGFAGYGVEVRGRRFDAKGRCETYNHLNMELLGALQLLYNLVTWAWSSYIHPTALRAMAFSCFNGCGCRRAGRESVRALRTS